jgi:hypothetical protein
MVGENIWWGSFSPVELEHWNARVAASFLSLLSRPEEKGEMFRLLDMSFTEVREDEGNLGDAASSPGVAKDCSMLEQGVLRTSEDWSMERLATLTASGQELNWLATVGRDEVASNKDPFPNIVHIGVLWQGMKNSLELLA